MKCKLVLHVFSNEIYQGGLLTANLLLALTLMPGQALAGCADPIIPCTTDCNFCHVFDLVENILSFILTCLTPVIASLFLMVGGFYFLTAGGDPSKINKARNIVFAVVVGVVIVFISWVALNTFMESIGVATKGNLGGIDLLNWWKIDCTVP